LLSHRTPVPIFKLQGNFLETFLYIRLVALLEKLTHLPRLRRGEYPYFQNRNNSITYIRPVAKPDEAINLSPVAEQIAPFYRVCNKSIISNAEKHHFHFQQTKKPTLPIIAHCPGMR